MEAKIRKSMKNSKIAMLSVILFGLFVAYSCEKNTVEKIPICKYITFSECKTLEDNEATSEVQITCDDKYLYVAHKDILLNCVFEKVNITSSVDGNTVELNIEESPVHADCLCPVDISYSVGEFEKGGYILIIKHNNRQIYSQTLVF